MSTRRRGAAGSAASSRLRREAILDAVGAIPEGFVRSYGDVSPGAPRLAGAVLRSTDADVPWWRVVRADGSLPLGERQRALLEAEGIPFDGARVDMGAAWIPPEAFE